MSYRAKSMTVEELVQYLLRYPPETEVCVQTRTKDIENIRAIEEGSFMVTDSVDTLKKLIIYG